MTEPNDTGALQRGKALRRKLSEPPPGLSTTVYPLPASSPNPFAALTLRGPIRFAGIIPLQPPPNEGESSGA